MAYNPLAFGQMLVGSGALVLSGYLWERFKGKDEKKLPALEKSFGVVMFLQGIIALLFSAQMYLVGPTPGHYIGVTP